MAPGQAQLAAAGAVSAMLLAGCAASTSGSGSSPPAGSSTQAAGSAYTLPAAVQSLKVSNPVGTVRVIASGSPEIHVTQRPTGNPTAYRQAAGSTATIGSHCPGGIRVGDCHMDFQIQMPAGAALNVVGDAGRVILSGGLAKTQINTHAGEVSGTGLGRGPVTVATQAGAVDLRFSSPPALAKVTTDAGAINVTVPPGGAYRVSASSGVGDKDVKVPNDANATNLIDLRAHVGSVSVHQG